MNRFSNLLRSRDAKFDNAADWMVANLAPSGLEVYAIPKGIVAKTVETFCYGLVCLCSFLIPKGIVAKTVETVPPRSLPQSSSDSKGNSRKDC